MNAVRTARHRPTPAVTAANVAPTNIVTASISVVMAPTDVVIPQVNSPVIRRLTSSVIPRLVRGTHRGTAPVQFPRTSRGMTEAMAGATMEELARAMTGQGARGMTGEVPSTIRLTSPATTIRDTSFNPSVFA
jgi:hypothetical protein